MPKYGETKLGNGIKYKWYNITGKTVQIKLNDSPDASVWSGVELPAVVIAEYKKFMIVEILPHYNPNQNMGISKPYRLGINKMDIHFGHTVVKEKNGKSYKRIR